MVATRPRLMQRTMSGSVVLPQSRSMLMSHGATKSHMKPKVWAATCGVVGDQGPCCYQSHSDLSGQGFHLELECQSD